MGKKSVKNQASHETAPESPEIESSDAMGIPSPELLELLRLRVAQMNHCEAGLYCHTTILRAQGTDETRLEQLETWETSDAFDGQERAAFALCDQMLKKADDPLPGLLIQELRHYFTKEAIISLTLAVMAANDWNFA